MQKKTAAIGIPVSSIGRKYLLGDWQKMSISKLPCIWVGRKYQFAIPVALTGRKYLKLRS
jgi:hypothetical protein